MSYTTRDRDRYRSVVAAVTGLTAAGALTATGLLVGTAADHFAAQQADEDQSSQQPAVLGQGADRQAAQRRVTHLRGDDESRDADDRVVTRGPRHRPYVTRVTTRYVVGADTFAAVGPGGAVSANSTARALDQVTAAAPPPQVAPPQVPPPPAPVAPAAPPPPAPSSGS
jgi:hypothetical protein